MTLIAALYYVAASSQVDETELREVVGQGAHPCPIRVGQLLPAVVEAHSLVVIDVSVGSAPPYPPANLGPDHQLVVAVSRDSALPVEWIQFLRDPNVQLLVLDQPCTWGLHPRLAARLKRLLVDSEQDLVSGVLQCCGTLRSYGDLVEAVLSDPWSIRRPGDLAHAVGISEELLRERCADLGLKRMEHLVMFIRAAAFEYLTREMHLTVRAALRRVGIRDRSNFRRQRRRAEYLLGDLDYYKHSAATG